MFTVGADRAAAITVIEHSRAAFQRKERRGRVLLTTAAGHRADQRALRAVPQHLAHRTVARIPRAPAVARLPDGIDQVLGVDAE